MSFFQDSSVSYQGQTYQLVAQECDALVDSGNYWHGPKSPSTWLCVAVFRYARSKVGGSPDDIATQLAARAMGITEQTVRELIAWHENYMRWHDGDPDYTV